MTAGNSGRVAVIGAGVAGLVTARVLSDDGFEVSVFEREPAVGGVWAASKAYPGLRTNNPRETYAFADFTYTTDTDEFPTAAQVRGYLQAYARHFGLEPCLRCSTEVVSVAYASAPGCRRTRRFRVTTRPVLDSADSHTHEFDFVAVCNGVFCQPYLPRFSGAAAFTGTVAHSSQVPSPEALRGRRVVVVGAGKSALDCAAFAAREAASCTLVFRSPHWILPRYFFGRFRVDRVMFTRASELMLPAYHTTGRVEAVCRCLAAPLLGLARRGMNTLVTHLTKTPPGMVPDEPLHQGIENIGIGGAVYEVIRRGGLHVRRAGIAEFPGGDAVRLDSGELVDADVVICATGWRRDLSFLDVELRRLIKRDGCLDLYRHILPPQIPGLGFVGYASSANCPLTSELAAHWLSECFRGRLPLPDAPAMEEEVARVRRWTEETFPRRREGYFIGAHVAHYADELLRDMGLPARRRGNFLAEYLSPFRADRYDGLGRQRRRRRH